MSDLVGNPNCWLSRAQAHLNFDVVSPNQDMRLLYPGSQAPFWGEEVTSPAIVGLNTILVRLCHPIEGLGGLLTKFFWRDG